jgi:hypothetical protein
VTDSEYDEVAVAREEAPYRTAPGRERPALVRGQLGRGTDEPVPPIGCGPGFEPAGLASETPAARVAGVDSDQAKLAVARGRCPDIVPLRRGDATALAVEAGAFDAAASVQAHERVDGPGAALSDLHRTLDARDEHCPRFHLGSTVTGRWVEGRRARERCGASSFSLAWLCHLVDPSP